MRSGVSGGFRAHCARSLNSAARRWRSPRRAPGPSARSLSRSTERFRYSLRVPRLSLRVSQSVSQSAGATRFARIVPHLSRALFRKGGPPSERRRVWRASLSYFYPPFLTSSPPTFCFTDRGGRQPCVEITAGSPASLRAAAPERRRARERSCVPLCACVRSRAPAPARARPVKSRRFHASASPTARTAGHVEPGVAACQGRGGLPHPVCVQHLATAAAAQRLRRRQRHWAGSYYAIGCGRPGRGGGPGPTPGRGARPAPAPAPLREQAVRWHLPLDRPGSDQDIQRYIQFAQMPRVIACGFLPPSARYTWPPFPRARAAPMLHLRCTCYYTLETCESTIFFYIQLNFIYFVGQALISKSLFLLQVQSKSPHDVALVRTTANWDRISTYLVTFFKRNQVNTSPW